MFFILISYGCEEITDNIIDVEPQEYNIIEISAPDHFNYSQNDSTFSHSITISNVKYVSSVSYSLISHLSDSYLISNAAMNLSETGEDNTGTFSASFDLRQSFASGIYEIYYFVEDNINIYPENNKKAAAHSFTYFNGIGNQPPVLSNLSMRYVDEPITTLRDTVERNINVIWSVFVSDVNGALDISKVSFELFRPDNSFLGEFDMYDNGDFEGAGDQTAGDQIYSLKNSFGPTAPIGTWQMKFKAVDREGEQSNIINFEFYVK